MKAYHTNTIPCTLWYLRMKNDWEYNHLEEGHADTDSPSPKFDSQAVWNRGHWQKRFAWLNGFTVVNVGEAIDRV